MQQEAQRTKGLQIEDLKELANTAGPCLTIYVPREHAENTSRLEGVRFNSVLRLAEDTLSARGLGRDEITQLLDPVRNVQDDLDSPQSAQTRTLVVLRSPEVLRVFEVNQHLDESVSIGDHFNVVPIFKSLQESELSFYILALSQKHVRLLRCTSESSEEVPLPEQTPKSLNEWLNTRMPNESPDHGAKRPDDGSTGGSFTSTTDRDNKDEHLGNFYRVINKAIHETLKGDTHPMVLVGVEYEISMYRALNTYQHLAEDGVHGSPDSLKGGEMHKRALEIMHEHAKGPAKRALGLYEQMGGSDRVSTDPINIVKAAHQGRVAHLFVQDGARHNGLYDPSTMNVKADESGEDLINLAALQTIVFGGDVFVLPAAMIPKQAPVAAVLRF